MLPIIKTVSPQAKDVYKLLSGGRALNAQEIADKLKILPNAVYRVTKKLVDVGMIEQLSTYPISFKALPSQMAMNLYLVAATQNFKREFGSANPAVKVSNGPVISLIKDRPSLLRRESVDVRATYQSIDFVVSGHEVPEELMMAFRKAITVGAKVRLIVHQAERVRSKQVKKWKEIGVSIRYLPGFNMRLLVFDKRIVYVTSYDPEKPGSAFGVRFEYTPLALQMTELFEQNWQKAKVL